MQSDAATVSAYLASLPDTRRIALGAVRDVILKNLPDGFEETMNWGMISYEVPLRIAPDTYNGKPLSYVGLASQKNHMAVYLCSLYCIPGAEADFRKAWVATGRKLDMGKSCLRFRKLEDIDLQMIGKVVAATSVDEFIRLARRK